MKFAARARFSVWSILTLSIACAWAPLPTSAECENSVLFDAPIAFATGLNAHRVATGDFNEDGILDIAVTNGDIVNESISSVTILIGTGNRTYAPAQFYGVGRVPVAIATGDYNEDGITDLAIANKISSEISILIGLGAGGTGNGTFATVVQYAVPGRPFDLVTRDFDGDGILDLATCLNQVSRVALLKGLGSGGIGDGTFAVAGELNTNSPSTSLAVGDFNGDDIDDLVVTEYATGTVAVLRGTGSGPLGAGSFAPAAHYAAGPQPFAVAIADFNEDGFEDLAVANTSHAGTAVMLGNASGSFPSASIVPSGNTGTVASADFDDDGILDLAVGTGTGQNTGVVKVYLGLGSGGVGNGTFGTVTNYSTFSDAYHLITDDVDGDGLDDLLVAAGYDHFVSLLPGACEAAPPDPNNPVLTDVRDVPNDEGGRVFLTWTASALDVSGGPVNQYRVWRRIPAGAAVSQSQAARKNWLALSTTTPEGTAIVYWEALATLPAQRLPGYGYTAATTQDSMRHSNPYTAFFVSALTSNIDVFYSSNVDSGYSVDNNRPGPPHAFTGEVVTGGVQMSWDENPETDLSAYRVYRGASEDFVPSDENRIGAPSEVGYLDPGGTGEHFYKLSAVDEHENESDFAVLPPLATAGVGEGTVRLALGGAHPNPSRGELWTVSLSLPDAGHASIEILDLAGRRVGYQDLSALGPGRHHVALRDAARLPSGVYVIRLAQGNATREIKAVVAR